MNLVPYVVVTEYAGHSTRPDTWLPQLCIGGQGLYLRSIDHFGRSSESAKKQKK